MNSHTIELPRWAIESNASASSLNFDIVGRPPLVSSLTPTSNGAQFPLPLSSRSYVPPPSQQYSRKRPLSASMRIRRGEGRSPVGPNIQHGDASDEQYTRLQSLGSQSHRGPQQQEAFSIKGRASDSSRDSARSVARPSSARPASVSSCYQRRRNDDGAHAHAIHDDNGQKSNSKHTRGIDADEEGEVSDGLDGNDGEERGVSHHRQYARISRTASPSRTSPRHSKRSPSPAPAHKRSPSTVRLRDRTSAKKGSGKDREKNVKKGSKARRKQNIDRPWRGKARRKKNRKRKGSSKKARKTGSTQSVTNTHTRPSAAQAQAPFSQPGARGRLFSASKAEWCNSTAIDNELLSSSASTPSSSTAVTAKEYQAPYLAHLRKNSSRAPRDAQAHSQSFSHSHSHSHSHSLTQSYEHARARSSSFSRVMNRLGRGIFNPISPGSNEDEGILPDNNLQYTQQQQQQQQPPPPPLGPEGKGFDSDHHGIIQGEFIYSNQNQNQNRNHDSPGPVPSLSPAPSIPASTSTPMSPLPASAYMKQYRRPRVHLQARKPSTADSRKTAGAPLGETMRIYSEVYRTPAAAAAARKEKKR